MNIQYSRTNKLLRKKFFQYLLPTMITYAALSLNEFVDSMLVSNLLDSDAMALVAVLLAGKKIRVYYSRSISRSLGVLREIAQKGGPDALTQIGFSLQFAVINALAGNLAGTAGIVAFSLCRQQAR